MPTYSKFLKQLANENFTSFFLIVYIHVNAIVYKRSFNETNELVYCAGK